ncbi:Imm1 family immunity protein [Actinosynnema sp. NPDC050436]|uniref:Imm1 family immunity protein n=1 Tax=Actinosynnema sp. NPDC050436 TaxID=3155659 RepID=UPI0033FD91A5
MVALEAWYDVDHDEPAMIHTAADLDRVLDTVAGWEGRVIVELFVADDPRRAIFDVGVYGQGERGALYYAGRGEKWFSRGTMAAPSTVSPAERLSYYYMTSDTEYPGDSEIPLDVVRRAAHEYMRTGGERPTSPTWQAAPDRRV